MNPLRILVVEDEPLIAMLLADILAEMGHSVCAVEATETGAVAAAKKYHPEMIIVDDGLMEGSGISAIERILLSGFIPHVFVSGGDLGRERLSPRAIILHKPFFESDLAGAIQKALGVVSETYQIRPRAGTRRSMMAKQVGNDERTKANPEAKDLENPREVWKDGTMVPSSTAGEPESGPLGRVADAGTLGAGSTSPYGPEIQAEIISGQTMRQEPPAKPAVQPKPKAR